MSRLYLALVHYPVLDRRGRIVSTSLTTLDLHDIARSATTYGAEALVIVTPLRSQLGLAQTMLAYWRHGLGGQWCHNRKQAMQRVETAGDLSELAERLTRREGAAPVLLATSASATPPYTTLAELRERLARDGPPLVLVLGTGAGLAPEALAQCHEMLEPIRGVGEYNHLSVRSAAAIYLDRLRR
ncbi:RNA methyltransferase [bacterium]|nr:RNA methyltransferase [bacterium]